MRAGTMGTTLSYTGQRLDATGLLYYRYYNPVLARFISADSVVPGAGALTVTPSDATAQTAWAQGGKDREGKPAALQNPQALNRYSYVLNNPIKQTDPSGHCSGGSTWNNFVSVFNGTCFQRGMAIMAHAKTPGDWALGAFAAVGPSAAIALLTAGTFGLGAVAIAGSGVSATAATATATAPLAKFADYIFKEGDPSGKGAIFRSLGYGAGHSEQLAETYEQQAASKFAQGDYTLGKLDKWGQRIDVVIDLPEVGDAAGKVSHIVSGWMLRSDGSITLNTPFSGFSR